MNIAKVYGERLDAVSRNLRPGALIDLLGAYPEHGFVIDGREAATLFKNVSPMPYDIEEISNKFLPQMRQAIFDGSGFFHIITDESKTIAC